jgi:hypothetical protein
MPVLDGKLRNSSIAASNPPADPPIPAIGQARPFGFERAVRRADFDGADVLRLDLVRDDDALRFSFCFALMAVLMLMAAHDLNKASFPDAAAVFYAERI